MQKKNILVKLTSVLFILAIGWILYMLIEKVNHPSKSNTSNYLPIETNWIVEFNTRSLIEKGIQSVLFSEDPDEELNILIGELIQSQSNFGVKIEDIGLNLNENIFLFEIEKKGQVFICSMFDLISPEKFTKNLSNLLPDNFSSFNNDKIGLIIYGKDGKHQMLADELLEEQNPISNPTPFSIRAKTKSTSFSSAINLSILDSTLLLEGNFHILNHNIASNIALKPKGLHFTTRFIPQMVSDSICSFFNLEKNQLIGLSLNHSSSELISKPKLLLKLNSSILFHFRDSISIQNLIENIASHEKVMSLDSTSFVIGETQYFFHQISPNSFYIGSRVFKKSMLTHIEEVFHIEGKPSNLTNIEGNGIVRRFIGVIPAFYASETFTNSIESMRFSSTDNSKGENKFKGNIQFKNGKKSMNELIRFILLISQE